jgi:hypothetical protein
VSQLFFRPFGAESIANLYPRLAPWAVILRRFAAVIAFIAYPKCSSEMPCDDLTQLPPIARPALLPGRLHSHRRTH